MGMFDYFKSSYNIGALTDVECQTKDMDPFGGTMSFFWLDPAGLLWSSDYTGTHAIEMNEDENAPIWKKLKYIPTGVHGRFYRVYITDYINVYDAVTHPDGLIDITECRIHLVDGQIKDFTYINNHI